VARTISTIVQKKSGWKSNVVKAEKAVFEEDLPERKKMKQIAIE